MYKKISKKHIVAVGTILFFIFIITYNINQNKLRSFICIIQFKTEINKLLFILLLIRQVLKLCLKKEI